MSGNGTLKSGIREFLVRHVPAELRFTARRLRNSRGSQYCPVCDSHVPGFVKSGFDVAIAKTRPIVGLGLSAQSACPNCLGKSRSRLIHHYLSHEVFGGEKKTGHARSVLHVAPEYSLYRYLSRMPDVIYTGIDLDVSQYHGMKNLKQADLHDLPFEDAQFDVIICSHVLEHVTDDRRCLQELKRVLKPDGHALLIVPYALDELPTDEDPALTDIDERIARFGQDDHIRLYNYADFRSRIKEAGFDVLEYNPARSSPALVTELKFNPDETLLAGRLR